MRFVYLLQRAKRGFGEDVGLGSETDPGWRKSTAMEG